MGKLRVNKELRFTILIEMINPRHPPILQVNEYIFSYQLLDNGDYQACSKLALLDQKYSKSFAYQLKTLNPASYKNIEKCFSSSDNTTATRSSSPKSLSLAQIQLAKDNTELFNKQVVKNLVDSIEESASKKMIAMARSRSLGSFQPGDQELHTFDCQGGSEELCEDTKSEDISLDLTEDALDNEPEEPDDNTISEFNKNLDHIRDMMVEENRNKPNSTMSNRDVISQEIISSSHTNALNENLSRQQNENSHRNKDSLTDNEANDMLTDATNVVKFFMTEIDDGAHAIMREVLHAALEFWIEHNLPIHTLEKVLLENIKKLFYPLGLLLFW